MAKSKELAVVEDAPVEKAEAALPAVVEDVGGVPYCTASGDVVLGLWKKYGATRVKLLRHLTVGEIEARLRSE